MPPKVCLYTPNYNYHQRGFLTECLDSLILQTYDPLEILIIDDGSTDGSQEVIQDYAKQDKRITFIAKEHKGLRWGQGWINLGLEWAKEKGCKFFAICDSDDKLEVDFWQTVLPYFTSPEIGIVRVGVWMMEKGQKDRWIKPKPFNGPADLLVQNTINVSSPFRLEVYKEIGAWDDVAWNDWIYWLRAILRYGWKWNTCNQPVFYYRKHASQMSQESHTTKFNEQIEQMREKYAEDLKRQQLKRGFGSWT